MKILIIENEEPLAKHLSGEVADMMDNYDFMYTYIKNLKKNCRMQDAVNI